MSFRSTLPIYVSLLGKIKAIDELKKGAFSRLWPDNGEGLSFFDL